jgi:hypothetical protein
MERQSKDGKKMTSVTYIHTRSLYFENTIAIDISHMHTPPTRASIFENTIDRQLTFDRYIYTY